MELRYIVHVHQLPLEPLQGGAGLLHQRVRVPHFGALDEGSNHPSAQHVHDAPVPCTAQTVLGLLQTAQRLLSRICRLVYFPSVVHLCHRSFSFLQKQTRPPPESGKRSVNPLSGFSINIREELFNREFRTISGAKVHAAAALPFLQGNPYSVALSDCPEPSARPSRIW